MHEGIGAEKVEEDVEEGSQWRKEGWRDQGEEW